ncbi:stage II sporulation protein M [Rapidithrix thailandica]|uniref:Stage II sporulation protein M n=1 Tax=Rapidithrix thailandica TaxID=413964 RepID=A0AAW9SBA3_9BACT
MRESLFIQKNKKKWERTDRWLKDPSEHNPDTLADLFIELTDDLSYAKTYYPKSQITTYLNQLTATAHQIIYKNKKEKSSRILTFWTQELPQVLAEAYPQILYATLFFLTFVLIGVVSAAHDDTFVRLIMGDAYVNMTIENIKNNDPMAVYKQASELDMFFAITLNNIRVSFYAFAMGILGSVGTLFILLNNGIMLGAFQYFFFKYDLLFTSVLTIWIHGTLEISAIMIAGGAGLCMGNSLLFPGTYSRYQSFLKGVKRGLKIIVGLIPIFIMAGFLEGFVTRHTEFPVFVKLCIIIASAALIVWYFFILPYRIRKASQAPKNQPLQTLTQKHE